MLPKPLFLLHSIIKSIRRGQAHWSHVDSRQEMDDKERRDIGAEAKQKVSYPLRHQEERSHKYASAPNFPPPSSRRSARYLGQNFGITGETRRTVSGMLGISLSGDATCQESLNRNWKPPFRREWRLFFGSRESRMEGRMSTGRLRVGECMIFPLVRRALPPPHRCCCFIKHEPTPSSYPKPMIHVDPIRGMFHYAAGWENTAHTFFTTECSLVSWHITEWMEGHSTTCQERRPSRISRMTKM